VFALPVFNVHDANKAILHPKNVSAVPRLNHQKMRFCSTSSEVNRDTEAPHSGVISA
jgi:hypothetical protein